MELKDESKNCNSCTRDHSSYNYQIKNKFIDQELYQQLYNSSYKNSRVNQQTVRVNRFLPVRKPCEPISTRVNRFLPVRNPCATRAQTVRNRVNRLQPVRNPCATRVNQFLAFTSIFPKKKPESEEIN